MNSLLAQILIITGAFSFFLFVSTFPFVDDDDKSPPLFIWLYSIGIYSLASIFLGLIYIFNPIEFGPKNIYVQAGFLSLVTGYTGGIIFFRYLSRLVSWKKVGVILVSILIVNFTFINLLLKLPADLRIIGPSLWTVILSVWLFIELNQVVKGKKDYLVYVLKMTMFATFAPSFLWLGVLVCYHMHLMHGLQWEDIIYFDNFVRIIRNISSPFAFLLLFMYWVKYYSSFAKESERAKIRVDFLIKEKDKLILELSNINSLVSTGALAAGLAHELNQYLARIQLNAEEALSKIDANQMSSVQTGLQRIVKANSEAATLITSLKRLLQGGSQPQDMLSIQGIITSICEIYKARLLKSKINLYSFLDEKDYSVSWGALLSQVISNLLSNAIEALDTVDSSNKKISIYYEITEKSLQLKVFDNGPSIDPKAAINLFTIFNTSKSQGSGIGLWLSKFIVQRYGGDLFFENMPDGGVTFIVDLPLDHLNKRLLS